MELHLLSPADPPVMPHRGRISLAAICSIAAHVGVLGFLMWVTYTHDRRVTPDSEATAARVIWVAMPGPAGGGGGSKVATPAPRQITPPRATRSIEPPAPAVTPTEILPAPVPEPAASAALIADVSTSGAADSGPASPGSGTGDGSGPGDGHGAGPGQGGGIGGGPYLPGNGVSSPIPIRRAPPSYTAEAMRARAQGVITVACVVEPNGECGEVRVVRAFTPPFGLDVQALEAARRWHFRPGTRGGEAVPVLVNLEIEFNIR